MAHKRETLAHTIYFRLLSSLSPLLVYPGKGQRHAGGTENHFPKTTV